MIVKVIDRVESYKEAIKLSCDILEANGDIDGKYYEAIIGKINEFGPYFCLTEGVCMPHARPEDGVKSSNLCVLKLNEPVDFLGKNISVFFTLSAVDSSSHVETLRKIAEVCMNGEKLNLIIKSKNENEIQEVI
ncbi:PTS sugar transporter subunit IIA [Clostridium frigidicarnis]|uniref:Ascorbate-specific PTS system EIIA component n=1 Tax=Clostridium frigidicarnis TaxID=84698 RepID=A0A1I0ZY06_9CLOT|nr:PTS sugar transporter subunit IIA [Clostridium frigidicarnis]SFB28983.1 PTS system IIA component, L-Asc family [Clostridium frigidicarnis]